MSKTGLNPSALRLLPEIPTIETPISNADYTSKTGLSRRQVQRAFEDLEAAGAVVRGYGRHDGTARSSRTSKRVWSDAQVKELISRA